MKHTLRTDNIPEGTAWAFSAILRERDYQDAKYGPIESRPLTVGEWLLILESELNEAKQAWVKGSGDDDALREILQVAAVAVACMQEHGVMERSTEAYQKNGHGA